MANGYRFETTCVGADESDLSAMWETAREIDYSAFSAELGEEEVLPFENSVPPLSREPYAAFHQAIYRGRPVIVLTHSHVNHLWVK